MFLHSLVYDLFPSATLNGNRDFLSLVAPEIFITWLGGDENKLGLNRVKLREWQSVIFRLAWKSILGSHSVCGSHDGQDFFQQPTVL